MTVVSTLTCGFSFTVSPVGTAVLNTMTLRACLQGEKAIFKSTEGKFNEIKSGDLIGWRCLQKFVEPMSKSQISDVETDVT